MGRILGVSIPALALVTAGTYFAPTIANNAQQQMEQYRQNRVVTERTGQFVGTAACSSGRFVVFDTTETGGLQDKDGDIRIGCSNGKNIRGLKTFVPGDTTKTPIDGEEAPDADSTVVITVDYSYQGSNSDPNTPTFLTDESLIFSGKLDITTSDNSDFKILGAVITPVS